MFLSRFQLSSSFHARPQFRPCVLQEGLRHPRRPGLDQNNQWVCSPGALLSVLTVWPASCSGLPHYVLYSSKPSHRVSVITPLAPYKRRLKTGPRSQSAQDRAGLPGRPVSGAHTHQATRCSALSACPIHTGTAGVCSPRGGSPSSGESAGRAPPWDLERLCSCLSGVSCAPPVSA